MTTQSEAQAHLAKAQEFLQAAELSLDLEMPNAACSSAVTAGINAKDAICLMLVGATSKSDNHAAAVAELGSAGQLGHDLSSTFSRLLSLKTKSQYQASSVSASDASRAAGWARRMITAALQISPT